MGSGYRGDFGPTKGSKLSRIVSSNRNSTLTINNASKEVKNIASKSPLKIPNHATYNLQKKKGYNQIKYKFNKNNNEYEVRWHTQTPSAPKGTGNTYQITRRKKGVGYGKNASKKVLEHMIKYPSGKTKWVSNSAYQNAIRNNKMGKASKYEKEMIRYGHIK